MFAPRTLRFAAFLSAAFAVTLFASSPSLGQKKEEPPKKAEEKKPADAKKVKSKLKITVPQDDAELRIEKKDTKPTGAVREFETPDIDAGKPYEYEFSVTWRPNNYTVITRTKSAEFKGGEDIVVDLTKADPKNPDKIVVRWVPTPDDIVDEMIKMAKVTKEDVVYEPGPGDGKVLIAAAKAGAKKCVGIELDPKKAAEATGKVKDAKMDKVVTINEGDALKADYSEATVVFLYMGEEFNKVLLPVLQKQLKPGTRIVSHRFTFGTEWKADETKKVTGQDGDEYLLHIWTVKKK